MAVVARDGCCGRRRRSIPPGGGNPPVRRRWRGVGLARRRIWWTLPVDRPVRRHLGALLGAGLGRSQAAAAAAHLPRQHRRAGQVLQHRDALARSAQSMTEGPSPLESVMITIGATTMRVFVGLVIASVLAIGIGVLVRYWHCLRPAGAADHHAALAGVADRLAAGGDLHVRHRQCAGDLHGRGGAVLPHGAGDHQPRSTGSTPT